VPVLSAAPWTEPLAAIDYSRILIIDNGDLTWCRPRNLAYAALYNIPAANVVSLSFGTNLGTYEPTSQAQIHSLFDVVQAELDRLKPAMLIFGAGVPARMLWWQREGSVGAWTISTTTKVTCALWPSLASTRKRIGTGFYTAGSAGGASLGVNVVEEIGSLQPTPVVVNLAGSGSTDLCLDQFNSPVSLYREYTLPDTSGNVLVRVPTREGLQTALRGTLQSVPYGKFGWGDIWQRGPFEDDTKIGQLLDRILLARGVDPYGGTGGQLGKGYPRAKKILMSLMESAPYALENTCAWAWLMRGWGLDVDYYYHNGLTPTAPWDTRLPLSGAVCTWAAFQAGLSPPRSVYWHCGCCGNNEIFESPALPFEQNVVFRAGGHSTITLLSLGNEWNVQAVSEKTALAGTTDVIHRGAAQMAFQFSTWHALLRGMPYLLATWWQTSAGGGAGIAIGDPLWAPFYQPDERRRIIRSGRRKHP
jgi:hypothetical protein